PKYQYKLAWHDRFAAHAKQLLDTGLPVALAGDFNIVPEPRDIYPTRSYDDNALVQPQSRAAFAALVERGWTDALRKVFPKEEKLYTFWDYRRNRWPRDAGLRLDHILLSKTLVRKLKAAGIDRAVRGEDNASDHAPVWVEVET
ncbi:MAG: exodeoxyribonuclease III, partial [Mesorhizobium sp.]